MLIVNTGTFKFFKIFLAYFFEREITGKKPLQLNVWVFFPLKL